MQNQQCKKINTSFRNLTASDKMMLTSYLHSSRKRLSRGVSGLPPRRLWGGLAGVALGAGHAAPPLFLLSVVAAEIGGSSVYLQPVVAGLQVCRK